MRKVDSKKRYIKAAKLCKKRGLDMYKLLYIVECLRTGKPTPPSCRPHKLVGNHVGKWECHIEPDWLLVYTIDDHTLTLLDTGTHSDLFP